jgi:hypothetical protein
MLRRKNVKCGHTPSLDFLSEKMQQQPVRKRRIKYQSDLCSSDKSTNNNQRKSTRGNVHIPTQYIVAMNIVLG